MTKIKNKPTKTNDKPPEDIARWRVLLKTIQSSFPSPWREEGDDQIFENTFLNAVSQLNQMKHPRMFREQKAWQGYLGDPALPDYSQCKDVEFDNKMRSLPEVIE